MQDVGAFPKHKAKWRGYMGIDRTLLGWPSKNLLKSISIQGPLLKPLGKILNIPGACPDSGGSYEHSS